MNATNRDFVAVSNRPNSNPNTRMFGSVQWHSMNPAKHKIKTIVNTCSIINHKDLDPPRRLDMFSVSVSYIFVPIAMKSYTKNTNLKKKEDHLNFAIELFSFHTHIYLCSLGAIISSGRTWLSKSSSLRALSSMALSLRVRPFLWAFLATLLAMS